MTTGLTATVVITWCFTPSQPLRLYQGELTAIRTKQSFNKPFKSFRHYRRSPTSRTATSRNDGDHEDYGDDSVYTDVDILVYL